MMKREHAKKGHSLKEHAKKRCSPSGYVKRKEHSSRKDAKRKWGHGLNEHVKRDQCGPNERWKEHSL